MPVGVVAVQGGVDAHRRVLQRLGVASVEIRGPEHLTGIDALILPGGESTTIWKLLGSTGLRDPLAEALADGMAVLGTCAGMILLASRVVGAGSDQASFASIDMTVRRNAYGTQISSFEAPLDMNDDPDKPFPGVFIRAPQVERLGEGVRVLATCKGLAVAVAAGSCLASAFHPELGGDDRIHRLLLEAGGL